MPGIRPSPLIILFMIPAEVNSLLGPLSSDTFLARIKDGQFESSYSGAAFTVTYFSCDTFFARIGYDAVMPIYYQLGRGSGGAAFTVTSFSSENSDA